MPLSILLAGAYSCTSSCNCDEITYNEEAHSFVKGADLYSGKCTTKNSENGEVVYNYKNGKIMKATSKYVNGTLEILGNSDGIISVKYIAKNGNLRINLLANQGSHYGDDFRYQLIDNRDINIDNVTNSRPGSYAKSPNGEKYIDFYTEKKPITVRGVILNILAEEYLPSDKYDKKRLTGLVLENPKNSNIIVYDKATVYDDTSEKIISHLLQPNRLDPNVYGYFGGGDVEKQKALFGHVIK